MAQVRYFKHWPYLLASTNIKSWIISWADQPETGPFLSAQMAVRSSFFQVFIVLGMYNFGACYKIIIVADIPISHNDSGYYCKHSFY